MEKELMSKDMARITFLVAQLPGGAHVESEALNYSVKDLMACHHEIVKQIHSELDGDLVLESTVMREMLLAMAETFAEGRGE